MPKNGEVKKSFPYSVDGATVETLGVGRVLAFPDAIFPGLEEKGYIEESDREPENSVSEATSRDVATAEIRERLRGSTDADLKAIIARSGIPVSGNLVHAELVAAAAGQISREARGVSPVKGVDPDSGVTEQPLGAPGAPTPPSAPAAVTAALGNVASGTRSVDGSGQTSAPFTNGTGADDSGPARDGLDDMTVEGLRALAESEKVDLGTSSRKADIVSAIRAKRA